MPQADKRSVLYCKRDIPDLGARAGDVVIVDGHGVRVLHPTAARAVDVVALVVADALIPHGPAPVAVPA